jgi:4'-phosphopantetheinyl transferase EntD
MTTAKDPLLQQMIDAMAVPGILVAHRIISPGDEFALLPEEFGAFAKSVIKVRRASGAARTAARELLPRLGQAQRAVPKSPSGMPAWPDGIVGSLAHDDEIAVAALALRRDFVGLGIDIEPAKALDPDLLAIVATPSERARIEEDPLQGRLLFAIKEAVYKAVYPLDRIFLDHHDVEVSVAGGRATVRNGRIVPFKYRIGPRIVVLAFLSATPVST